MEFWLLGDPRKLGNWSFKTKSRWISVLTVCLIRAFLKVASLFLVWEVLKARQITCSHDLIEHWCASVEPHNPEL